MNVFLLKLRYRWAMANAYLTQLYAPHASRQWLREADRCELELWRMSI